MANEDQEDGVDKAQEKGKKVAKHDSGAADLEKVTDYAEEREVVSQDIAGAIDLLNKQHIQEAAERLERERELAKISIKKEDVELMVKELEINRTRAERILRENRGNLVEALSQVVNS